MPEYDCCVCEEPFQFGPHVYAGRLIPGWHGLMICRKCDHANHDGIVPGTYPNLMPRREVLGVKISLNKNGCIVVPSTLESRD
jgi:hypothetical protein